MNSNAIKIALLLFITTSPANAMWQALLEICMDDITEQTYAYAVALLNKDVNPNCVTPVQQCGFGTIGHETPLYLLVSRYNEPLVRSLIKLLIKKGADPAIEDCEGFTPLHLAAPHNNTRLIKRLIKAGAPVNACNNQVKATPLDLCVPSDLNKHDIEPARRLLIEAGANLNHINPSGNTIFHCYAAKATEQEGLFIEFCLKHNANPFQPNKNGIMPLDFPIVKKALANSLQVSEFDLVMGMRTFGVPPPLRNNLKGLRRHFESQTPRLSKPKKSLLPETNLH